MPPRKMYFIILILSQSFNLITPSPHHPISVKEQFRTNLIIPPFNDNNESLRNKRQLAALASVVIPTITKFMGSLIAPLFSSISNRPGNSVHNQKLLQRFIPRALHGTQLGGTEVQTHIQSAVKSNKFNIALTALRNRERPLDKSNFTPLRISSYGNLSIMETKKIFLQLTTVIDNLFKKKALNFKQLIK